MAIRIQGLADEDLPKFEARVAALEDGITYPLGDDRFSLDHGASYFAFFQRLGELRYFVVLDGDDVVGVGCGILRTLPFAVGQQPRTCWYCCDMKVRRDYRGKRIPLRMLGYALNNNYLRCGRGYAITMNPGDGSENRVVRLMQRFRPLPLPFAGTLLLWSLDAEAMRATAPLLTEHRGPLSYLSLQDKKDIVLQSTGASMPLLHVQFGPCAEAGGAQPVEGSTHMFCAMSDDALTDELHRRGLEPTASASILHHRMGKADWRFVLTSDI